MESHLRTTDNSAVLERVQLYGICAFVALIWLRQDLGHIVLICTLFVSLFRFRKEHLLNRWPVILLLIQLYLVAVFSTFYSEDKKEALFVLQKQLTIFLVPLIFGVSLSLTMNEIRKVLLCFSLSVSVACIYLLFVFYQSYNFDAEGQGLGVFLGKHLHHSFSEPLHLHATYLSIYTCFAICVLSYFVFNDKRWIRWISLILLPFLMLSIVILSSRIILLPLAIILIFLLPFHIRRPALFIYFAALLCIGIVCFRYLGNFDAIKVRLKNDTMRELNLSSDSTRFLSFDSIHTNDATRAERWNCAVELFKEKPFLGYGTGEEKNMLKVKYLKYGLSNSVTANFDAHNQYLAFAIKSGLLGLISFIVLLLVSFIRAVRQRDFYFISFLLIICTTALTENILESNKGILFFAMFISLFSFRLKSGVKSTNSTSPA